MLRASGGHRKIAGLQLTSCYVLQSVMGEMCGGQCDSSNTSSAPQHVQAHTKQCDKGTWQRHSGEQASHVFSPWLFCNATARRRRDKIGLVCVGVFWL